MLNHNINQNLNNTKIQIEIKKDNQINNFDNYYKSENKSSENLFKRVTAEKIIDKKKPRRIKNANYLKYLFSYTFDAKVSNEICNFTKNVNNYQKDISAEIARLKKEIKDNEVDKNYEEMKKKVNLI